MDTAPAPLPLFRVHSGDHEPARLTRVSEVPFIPSVDGAEIAGTLWQVWHLIDELSYALPAGLCRPERLDELGDYFSQLGADLHALSGATAPTVEVPISGSLGDE